MERVIGKVKWFNDSKGIGFIKRVGESDVFVHYKSIQTEGHKTLRKGQEVSFTLETTEFGIQAMNVQIESAPSTSKNPQSEVAQVNN
ncbi:Major cold shock protein CspA [Marinomonas spartinae]|uniref:Major cold shock protein CspA n=1 Tax=Marinomonas spartinae TaxID=1792290 RepID=A0A1A8TS10_9GAMM|nr:cold shock domain-containing protein [Marinomonas spartinae]SBS37400.1 Major cold shock protein CspA [Marinomonas spartinae]SBS38641.1 Major cold shock protein CspA [Marinomonas spartinae]